MFNHLQSVISEPGTSDMLSSSYKENSTVSNMCKSIYNQSNFMNLKNVIISFMITMSLGKILNLFSKMLKFFK